MIFWLDLKEICGMFSQKTLPDISVQTTELLKNTFWGIPYQAPLNCTSQSYSAYALAFYFQKLKIFRFFLWHDGNTGFMNKKIFTGSLELNLKFKRCVWDMGIKRGQDNFWPQLTFIAMETSDNPRKREIRAVQLVPGRVKSIVSFLKLTLMPYRAFSSSALWTFL